MKLFLIIIFLYICYKTIASLFLSFNKNNDKNNDKDNDVIDVDYEEVE